MSRNSSSPLALFGILIFTGLCMGARAQDSLPEKPQETSTIRCSQEDGLALDLPTSFERIETQHQGVLCAFRSKTSGFPTINVISQPQLGIDTPRTASQRREDILQSYRSVGLTDATLGISSDLRVSGLPAFRTEVRYTNRNAPMAALVLVVELPDRRYILSALDTAAGYERSKDLLSDVLDSLTVESSRAEGTSSGRTANKTILTLTLIVAVALVVALFILKRLRRPQ